MSSFGVPHRGRQVADDEVRAEAEGVFVCPYCKSDVAVMPDGVAHKEPVCERFARSTAEEFVTAVAALQDGSAN